MVCHGWYTGCLLKKLQCAARPVHQNSALRVWLEYALYKSHTVVCLVYTDCMVYADCMVYTDCMLSTKDMPHVCMCTQTVFLSKMQCAAEPAQQNSAD